MTKAEDLVCDVCGQRRWTAAKTVCSITLGCTGKMKKEGTDGAVVRPRRSLADRNNVDGNVGTTTWEQGALSLSTEVR